MVIYIIENTINEKVYVGRCVNGKSRLTWHRGALRKNRHTNTHLQASWNKYGESAFKFSVIEDFGEEICNETLSQKEQEYILRYKSYNPVHGYNKTMGGEGEIPTEQTRKKLSETSPKFWKGKKFSLSHIENIKHALAGRDAWNKGKELSESHKKKLSENHANFTGENSSRFGKRHLSESKEKMSEKLKDAWKSGKFNNRSSNRDYAKTTEYCDNLAKLRRPNGYPTIVSPTGEEYNIINLAKFCREHNLNSGNMTMVVNGHKSHHKGWTIRTP
jgi:group I intron endonuclease